MGSLIEILIKKRKDEPAKTLRFLMKKRIFHESVLMEFGENDKGVLYRAYIWVGPDAASKFCKQLNEQRDSVLHSAVIC